MLIPFLHLTGFKRTKLAGVSSVEVKFESPIQVILGTNGCGKTSVMRQATLWPPETEHFLPGGGKICHAIRNGDLYIAKSLLKGKGWVHEFSINNGPNLNPGGTTSVQKELVSRYFNVNQDIVQLLTGDTRFSELSTAKRRELFTFLSPTDLSYALGVYNRTKAAARDTVGVRKHLENRIAQETAKLLDDETAKQYEDEANLLHSEIQLLLTNRKMMPHGSNVQAAERQLSMLVDSQLRCFDQMDRLSLNSIGYKDRESLNEFVMASIASVAAMTSRRDTMMSEFIDLGATLADIRNRSNGSKEDVEKRLREAQQSLATLRTHFDFEMPENCREAFRETEEIEKPLIAALTVMVGMLTEEFDFGREAKDLAQQEVNQALEGLARVRRELDRIRHRLEHLQNAELTDCPKCNTQFVPGERKGEREKLVEREQVLTRQLSLGEFAETKAREKLAHHEAFEAQLTIVRQLASAYPRCRPLFSAMIDAGFPYKANQRVLSMVFQWKEELHDMFRRRDLESNIEQLSSALEQMRLGEGESGIVLEGRSRALEVEIARLSESIDVADKSLKEATRLLKEVDQFQSQYDQASDLQQRTEQKLEEAIDLLRNQFIDELLREHQTRLAQLNNRLKERDVAVSLLRDLEEQLQQAKENEVAYQLILNELSPTDGLIAEQISGFIATFVRSVNIILAKAWSYPLTLLPCGFEGDELNYRFPVEIGHDREFCSDVAFASKGQVEFIDFAVAAALGLRIEPETGWPLFLDELGAAFDEEHRARIWQFVRDYIDAGKAPQAFAISHYAANHTALSNAQILVIDGNNVTVPRKHNEHAILK